MNIITLNKRYQGTCNLNVTVENFTKTLTITTECIGTAYCTPSINSSGLTYDGSSKELVSSTSTYGISQYYLGYKKGSQATSDGQITWTSANPTGGKLTATDAGTYYIYKKYTVNSNYYCGSNMTYTQVGTKTISQGGCIVETNGWVNNSTNSAYVEYNPIDSESVKLKVKNNSGTVTWPGTVTAKINSTTTSWQCASGGIVYIPAGTTGGTYEITATVTVAASSDGNRTSGTKSLKWSVTISPRTMDLTICGVDPEDIQNKTINYSVKYPNEAQLFIGTGFCAPTLYTGGYPPTQQTLYYIADIPSHSGGTFGGRSEIGTDTVYICLVPDNVNNWHLLPGYPNSDAIQVNLTVTKGDNPMTCSISRNTIYSENYTTATIWVSNPQGTITASLDTNSYVTISTYNSYSQTFTVTYKATGGPTTITITDTGNGNYNSITRQISVTCVTDEEYSTEYKDNACSTQGYNITSYGTPSVSIGSGMTAAGGSATVTCSVSNSAQWHQKWKSGYIKSHTGSKTGTAKWRITSNGNSRFSEPSSGGSVITVGGSNVTVYPTGTAASHSNMTTDATTDTVGITAYNVDDPTKTSGEKTANVSNAITNSNYSPSNYTASISIGNGLTAGGGSATVSASASHKAYDLYTSGSYNNQHNVSDSVTWEITSNGNSRFTKTNNTTLSHSNMTTNAVTDSVTVKATNSTDTTATATASKSITNAVESISLAVNGKTDATSVPFGSGTSNIVLTGTYTSGSTGTLTPKAVTSSDTTVATVS